MYETTWSRHLKILPPIGGAQYIMTYYSIVSINGGVFRCRAVIKLFDIAKHYLLYHFGIIHLDLVGANHKTY